MEGFSQVRSPSMGPFSSVHARLAPVAAAAAAYWLAAAEASSSARAESQSISGAGEVERLAAAKRCAVEAEFLLCSRVAGLLASTLRPPTYRPATCSQSFQRLVQLTLMNIQPVIVHSS